MQFLDGCMVQVGMIRVHCNLQKGERAWVQQNCRGCVQSLFLLHCFDGIGIGIGIGIDIGV